MINPAGYFEKSHMTNMLPGISVTVKHIAHVLTSKIGTSYTSDSNSEIGENDSDSPDVIN